ncbi:MAG TPA: hypothetical protein VN634_00900 [Candidatus Limnocylindrales bacterium]|nr:hypothetical protein [Candidatus Limnocylindrales bacterium]
MAKPNYSFEKRKRDLAKQQKKEAKRQKKLLESGKSGSESQPEIEAEPTADAPPPEEKIIP